MLNIFGKNDNLNLRLKLGVIKFKCNSRQFASFWQQRRISSQAFPHCNLIKCSAEKGWQADCPQTLLSTKSPINALLMHILKHTNCSQTYYYF